MTGRSALVAVTREKQANAALVAHQPFPIGLDTRPLHLEQSEALLTSPCMWTTSIPSFLFRHIAQQDGGASFGQLKESAEREFLTDNPDEVTFPVFRLADFLESAYRCGLLAKNFVSPNGDEYSPHRLVLYDITPSAQALLAHHAPLDIERKANTIPVLPDADIHSARENIAPVFDYLKKRGPSVRDTMLDNLTRALPDDVVQAHWDRLEDAIDQGIKLGMISQEEDRLGAYVLSILP